MTWVKICGLTREPDVAHAVDAGADALGFVLAPESPRVIDLRRAAELMHGVNALRVLVTVDTSAEDLAAAVRATGADGIQPHGRHAGDASRWGQAQGLLVLRPVRVGTNGVPELEAIPSEQIPLVDSASDGTHGGTGQSLDWEHLSPPDRRFVLAGGLNPTNVAAAIQIVQPWGIDASSGLESAPGIKDPARVAAFLQEAKRQ